MSPQDPQAPSAELLAGGLFLRGGGGDAGMASELLKPQPVMWGWGALPAQTHPGGLLALHRQPLDTGHTVCRS